ncbi:hypothetical protein SGLAD_v1c08950 [Spiroplasma gladiatoris]|uniref:Uncharacterized protein n=1 Tax=Spiroplasma gladiatoris TaxID=2143 RepID=A0A4P7AI14_9MOLU|nr:hypothetical protein SGLAD_v1c08950 [Spiroplasma gladiatoris]
MESLMKKHKKLLIFICASFLSPIIKSFIPFITIILFMTILFNLAKLIFFNIKSHLKKSSYYFIIFF